VAGDSVVLGVRENGYVCALYPGADRLTSGWLPEARLASAPLAPDGDWTGEWASGGSAWLTIRQTEGVLNVRGAAQWPPMGTQPEISPRTGDLDGTLRLDATGADYLDVEPDSGCHARFRRVGPYLAVVDDNNCGGLNVSFTGVYRRRN
jgi:hypothetical protein